MTHDLQLDAASALQPQLYRQLSQRILDQRYLPGTRLPSSRQLAADLGISRNTVNAVYDQLKAEGFLQTRAGQGVFVHQDIATTVRPRGPEPAQPVGSASLPPLPQSGQGRPTFSARTQATADDTNLPFQPGLPDLDAFPLRSWNRILHHHESRRGLLGYDSIQGFLPLRQAIASYLRSSRGVRCDADQVIVTNGAQQALALIADTFLRLGDRVFCENPGYRGARYALGRHSNPLVPVPLRNQVLDVSALANLGPARLLSCTPTHQYPMGGILDLSQRMALVDWAQASQCWIIEDDYDSEFHFYNKPFAAIQGMFDQAPVLYVGSFSKTLMPGLRLGYLVVPEPVVEPICRAKQVTGGETPILSQATVAEFIDSGLFLRHLRRMRQLYRDKWIHFQQQVTDRLAGQMHPVAESAGMHLVLEGHFDDVALYQRLRARGFGSTPLSAHFLNTPSKTGLVMGFASASERQIDDCVDALCQELEGLSGA